MNGSVCIASVVLGALGMMVATMAGLAMWAVTLPAATILLAILFSGNVASVPTPGDTVET